MVDQDPLGQGAPLGPSQGTPGSQGDQVSSALYHLQAQVNAAAAGGAEAYEQAFIKIQQHLENILVPAFGKLSKVDRETLAAYRKQFKEQENLAKAYFNTVSSEEEKRLRQIRDNLRKQEADIIQFHERVRIARQKEAKDAAGLDKIRQEEGLRSDRAISAARGAAHTQEVGGSTLSTMGAMLASEFVGMLAPVTAVLTLNTMAAVSSQLSKSFFATSGAASRASGLPGEMSTAGGYGNIRAAFGGLHGISEGSESDILGRTNFFARAPQLLNKSLTPAVGIMVQLGYTVEQATELIAKGSESASTSVGQLVDNLQFSAKAAQAFGFGTESTSKQVMDFARAIRATGASSDTANKQAQGWVATLQRTGKQMDLGTGEMDSFSQKFASAISGMSPSLAFGLVQATTGKMPVDLNDLSRQVGGGQDLAKSLYSLISHSVGKEEQKFVPEAFAKQFGIGHVDIQFAKVIQDAMGSGRNVTDELKKSGYQAPELNLKDASQNLVHIRGFMANIHEVLSVLIGPNVAAIARFVGARPESKTPEIKVVDPRFYEPNHRIPASQRNR